MDFYEAILTKVYGAGEKAVGAQIDRQAVGQLE
jgi:hypothetical protein